MLRNQCRKYKYVEAQAFLLKTMPRHLEAPVVADPFVPGVIFQVYMALSDYEFAQYRSLVEEFPFLVELEKVNNTVGVETWNQKEMPEQPIDLLTVLRHLINEHCHGNKEFLGDHWVENFDNL